MCLILHSKVGFDSISKSEFKNVLHANPDGIGIFWDSGSEAQVYKTAEIDYRSLRRLLREIGRTDCFVHFRMATNKVRGDEGAHPFPVFSEIDSIGYQIWVAHNGIFSKAPRDVHDSQWFIANTLRPILRRDPFIWRTTAFQDLLAQAIGESNRLAILDSSGKIARVGKWYDVGQGVVASNLYAWGRSYTSSSYSSWRDWDEFELEDNFGLNKTGYR
jgi:hypothetical protein